MSTPEHAPRPIRRRYRAYDMADEVQKSLMLFAQCVSTARRHLMMITTDRGMAEYHRDAARSEGKCARAVWNGLLERGFGQEKGALRA